MSLLTGDRRDTDPSLQFPGEVENVGEIEPIYELDHDLLTAISGTTDSYVGEHFSGYVERWLRDNAVIREMRENRGEYNSYTNANQARALRKLFPDTAGQNGRGRGYLGTDTLDEISALAEYREGKDDYLAWKHPLSPPKRPVVSRYRSEYENDSPRIATPDEAEAHIHSEIGRRFGAIMALDVLSADPRALNWRSPEEKNALIEGFRYDHISSLFSAAEQIASLYTSSGRLPDGSYFNTEQLPSAAVLAVSTLHEASHALLETSQSYMGGCTRIESYRPNEPDTFSQHPLIAMGREFITASAVIANHITPAFRNHHDAHIDSVGKLAIQDKLAAPDIAARELDTRERNTRDNLGHTLIALDHTYSVVGGALLDRLGTRVEVVAASKSGLTDEAKAELRAIGELVAAFGAPAHVRSSRELEAWGARIVKRVESIVGELPRTAFLSSLGSGDRNRVGVHPNEERHRRLWSPGDFTNSANQ